MEATRILLLFQTLATLLLVQVSCCSQACPAFVGQNGCRDNGLTEPRLPPRDNACCSPQCTKTAPNEGGPCSPTEASRCLLDTSCSKGLPFSFVCMSGCEIQTINQERLKNGFAPLITFNFKKSYCDGLNTKYRLNCCCRQTCPKRFCKIK
ncbi:uncharacterized protein LOC111071797 [Drosophila obscura]|uniref:uncharacterized protein LOC111071797 n=1 Tax=Drosophila obscura TaxID=7282 RepID=UPI001BB12F94|nr:uncharacterized protein LOC111071797 [Drosophila obscura]